MTLKPPLETLRLSERERDSLLQLKRLTGIEHWNALCRWALCASIAEGPVAPNQMEPPSDSSLEMSWRTFSGEIDVALLALLMPSEGQSLSEISPSRNLRLHLSRGIALLLARLSTDDTGRKANPARLVVQTMPR